MGIPQPPSPEQRIAQVNGLYSVLTRGLDEFARAISHPHALDGHYDPELCGGTVRFATSSGAQDMAKRLDG